jgi:hypothetical protein
MNPTPANYGQPSVFGSTSSRVIPLGPTYSGGYLPGQGFPAEHENYLMYNITNAIDILSNNVKSIQDELANFLTSQSVSPSSGSSAQVGTAITTLVSNSAPVLSNDNTTNATMYLLWSSTSSGALTSPKASSTKLTFNPSTGSFSATMLTGTSNVRIPTALPASLSDGDIWIS